MNEERMKDFLEIEGTPPEWFVCFCECYIKIQKLPSNMDQAHVVLSLTNRLAMDFLRLEKPLQEAQAIVKESASKIIRMAEEMAKQA